MHRMARVSALVGLLALTTGACFALGSDPTSPTTTPPAVESSTTAMTGTTIGTTTASTANDQAGDGAECGPSDVPFTEGGTVGSGGVEDSDAAVIEPFSWEMVGVCERLSLAFSTLEGAPAVSPPMVGVQFLRHAGVVRLTFATGVGDAIVGEQVVETALVERIYTVGQVDGRMHVDIHLRQPVFARMLMESAPASVMVDLMPGGSPFASPAVRDGDVVILPPDPSAIGYPITITGYTIAGEDRIDGVLTADDGTTVPGEAAAGVHGHIWGGFSMVFPAGPPGPVTIEVGDGPQLVLTIP